MSLQTIAYFVTKEEWSNASFALKVDSNQENMV